MGYKTDTERKQVLLVGLGHQQESMPLEASMAELGDLCATLGWEVVGQFTQMRAGASQAIGKGKLTEIAEYLQENPNITGVVFDHEISPSLWRDIEKRLNTAVLDRSLVILQLFSLRARSSQAKWQVELARHQYLLPRLVGRWTHLERQRGRLSTRGGAGEKEIETDRRQIHHRIDLLKKRLRKLSKQQQVQRQQRHALVRVALVGYTNVGKSSLMNVWTQAGVKAENVLFATLDTTVRRVRWEGVSFLLSDTVGFIQKLPHHLIEAFLSTLSEVQEADILLHVVDIAHPQLPQHIQVVTDTLKQLHAENKPTVLVCNKKDLLNPEQAEKQHNYISTLSQQYVAQCYTSTQDAASLAVLKSQVLRIIQNVAHS